jgi:hypothetical protein
VSRLVGSEMCIRDRFKSMCPNIEFHDLKSWQDVELAYKYATDNVGIHVLAEYPELYYA